MSRFAEAIARFDASNAEGPEFVAVGALRRPKEVLYAERMTAWLAKVDPAADESLQLAVRAQHLARFRLPRSDYPMDGPGYKAWRKAAGVMHAKLAGDTLAELGYGTEEIERVQSLIQKKRFKTDAQAQTLEDVACLVFLEHYLAEFCDQHSDEKVRDIIRKTWVKMSAAGHAAAGTIPFGEHERRLVEAALAGPEEV